MENVLKRNWGWKLQICVMWFEFYSMCRRRLRLLFSHFLCRFVSHATRTHTVCFRGIHGRKEKVQGIWRQRRWQRRRCKNRNWLSLWEARKWKIKYNSSHIRWIHDIDASTVFDRDHNLSVERRRFPCVCDVFLGWPNPKRVEHIWINDLEFNVRKDIPVALLRLCYEWEGDSGWVQMH